MTIKKDNIVMDRYDIYLYLSMANNRKGFMDAKKKKHKQTLCV